MFGQIKFKSNPENHHCVFVPSLGLSGSAVDGECHGGLAVDVGAGDVGAVQQQLVHAVLLDAGSVHRKYFTQSHSDLRVTKLQEMQKYRVYQREALIL